MTIIKCQHCNKDIIGGAKIQHFDKMEPTTIHVFCSEECKKKWISSQEKKKN
ncbi:MAG: hypothetical protein ACFFG0_50975 [Candidatus Thorarchaeota archaeon]